MKLLVNKTRDVDENPSFGPIVQAFTIILVLTVGPSTFGYEKVEWGQLQIRFNAWLNTLKTSIRI
jgi:hypothetical protein